MVGQEFLTKTLLPNSQTMIFTGLRDVSNRRSEKKKIYWHNSSAGAFAFTLVASLFVNLARTNPFHFPIDNNPDPGQPLLNVTSPNQNQIYNVTDIWLTFTVTKPEKWFGSDPLSYLGEVYNCNGEITFVRYSLDGKQSENFSANDDNWMIFIAVLCAELYAFRFI